LTDAGYVAGGYGVTVVAISAYIARMWARNRTLARATRAHPVDGPPAGPDTAGEAR